VAHDLTQDELDRLFGLRAADRVALARGELPAASGPMPAGCLALAVLPLGGGLGALAGLLATPLAEALGVYPWQLAAGLGVAGAVVPFLLLRGRDVGSRFARTARRFHVHSRVDTFTTVRAGTTVHLVDAEGGRYRMVPLAPAGVDVEGRYRLFFVDPAEHRDSAAGGSDRLAVGMEVVR
jgi:hypothetical protein